MINNVFLGDVGHGSKWAGLAHSNIVNTAGYGFLQDDSGQYTLINKKSGTGSIGFRIDNADKMVLADNGNVGIGTTSPAAKLDVEGDLKVTGKVTAPGMVTGSAFVIMDQTSNNILNNGCTPSGTGQCVKGNYCPAAKLVTIWSGYCTEFGVTPDKGQGHCYSYLCVSE